MGAFHLSSPWWSARAAVGDSTGVWPHRAFSVLRAYDLYRGISSWETRLRVPALSGLVPSDPWEVHAEGVEISDAWDRTAAMAITRFCDEQPIFTSFSSVVAFPARDQSTEFRRQRIDLLLYATLLGHVSSLARLIRHTAGLLRVCDNLRGENVLYR